MTRQAESRGEAWHLQEVLGGPASKAMVTCPWRNENGQNECRRVSGDEGIRSAGTFWIVSEEGEGVALRASSEAPNVSS